MNTWKHEAMRSIAIIGIIAVIALDFAFIACTTGNKKNNNKVFTPAIIEEVYVQGGTFEMGKDLGTAATGDLTPVHTVTLTGFYMSKYEVTQGQYQTVMGSLPSEFDNEYNIYNGKGNNYPVYYVSWYDAIEFCNKLSVLEGLTPYYTINKEQPDPNNENNGDTVKWLVTPNTTAAGYRLPTEAQWEYAAKGGNKGETFTYSGSDDPDAVAWYGYSIDNGEGSHAVGAKAPNGLGLYDMSGNVWEWCWDWHGNYTSGARTGPTGASSGSYRVVRGGYWGIPVKNVRSIYRSGSDPSSRSFIFGFRLVRP